MRILLVILLLPALASAYALPFLKESAGARAESMGGTAAAAPKGADAVFWNPGAMLLVSGCKNAFSCSYARLDYDRSGGYAAAFERSEDLSSALGVFWSGRYSGGIEERDALGNPGAMLSMSAGAAGLAGAFRLGPVKAGISLKYYYSSLTGAGGRGLGADLGVCGTPFGPWLVFGASVKDLSPGLYWDTGRVDPLPLSAVAGLCCKAIPEKLEFACDIEYLDGFSISFGMEYFIEEALYLRAGVSKSGPAFGIGINVQNYIIDYAFLPDKNSFGAEHTISFTFMY